MNWRRKTTAALALMSLMAALHISAQPPLLSAAAQPKTKKSVTKEQRSILHHLFRMNGLEGFFKNPKIWYVDGDQLKRPELGTENIQFIVNVLNRIYQSDEYRQDMEREFKRNFNRRNGVDALKWYRTPLAEKIVDLRSKIHDEVFLKRFREFVKRLERIPAREDRQKLIDRLELATDATDFNLDLLLSMIRLLYPFVDKYQTKTLRSVLKKEREELKAPLTKAVKNHLLFLYRDLNNNELIKYIRFLESSAGKWETNAIHKGFIKSMSVMMPRAQKLNNRLLDEMESGNYDFPLLKEVSPPGFRYILMRKRDPFSALVDAEEGRLEVARFGPRDDTRQFGGELKDIPPIPLEIMKKIKRDDPKMHAELESYARLFRNKEKLKKMDEDEYFEALENYRALLQTSADVQPLNTPLQIDYEALKLVGVINKGNERVGLIETNDKKGYTVRVGDLVGPNFGVVDSINATVVHIVERSRDYLGNILSKSQDLQFADLFEE